MEKIKKDQKSIKNLKKKNKEFKTKYLSRFISIIPFYLLSGIVKPEPTYDTTALAESFFDSGDGEVVSELWDLVEYLSTPSNDAASIMSMLYGGWCHFEKYESHDKLSNEVIERSQSKHKFGVLHASRYMIAGSIYKDWYRDTYEAFRDFLPGYDIELFVKVFAATSPMSHLRTNVILALRAYDCIKKGKSVSSLGVINSVQAMLEDIQKGIFDRDQCGRRRKVLNFKEAILGNVNAVVVDSQMLRAYDLAREYIWREKTICHLPKVGEYDLIEYHIRTLAEGCGYEPRQIVAMLWSGIRITQGKFKEADTRKVLKELVRQ